MAKSKKSRFIPIYVALGIVFGILVGNFYANQYSGKSLSVINASGNKLNDLLYIVDDQYVDTVDMAGIVEKALPQILRELDPHSVYISQKDVEASMQDLKGSFSGIGVQFFPYNDTVCVVQVIPGGPSERVGLLAGDRIVRVDDEEYVGEKVADNEETKKRLKGESGSTVKLGIVRPGVEKELTYTVVRGDVPVKTVDAAYMLNDSTGYIRIKSFGDTTYPEFLAALAKLNSYDFQNIILDLRGNLGGYMIPSVQIANEFLPKNRLIVYTEGRKSPREEYRSDGRGAYQEMPLIVLVDEISASSSEILSGAIQDNDRGTIIGRRTFGKGLVQIPIEFGDGSMLRLTKARYYTPSGRCLQKPYVPGGADYEMDLLNRLEHGEFYSKDSIRSSGKEYTTRIGRKVYGGGGIIPDVFIPRDTLGMTSYFKDAYIGGYFSTFAFDFVDKHRKDMKSLQSVEEVEKYLKKYNVVELFVQFAQKSGLKRRNLLIRKSRKLLDNYIKTAIISDLLDIESTVQFINTSDPSIESAVNLLHEGKAFPSKE